jgi:hypothetical protein
VVETTNGVRPGRTEQDGIFRSGLPVVFGGETYRLRPMTWERSDIWFEKVKSGLGTQTAALFASGDLAGFEKVLSAATGALLDLIVEYDETGTLPTREWFRGHATRREIYDAFVAILEYEQPPLDLARRLLPEEVRGPILGRLIAAMLAASAGSSSSPSANGDTARPTRSKRR